MEPGGLSGADGVDLRDVNGDGLPDITAGWEQSAYTSVQYHPGCGRTDVSWNGEILPGRTPGVEDAVFGDVDGDGLQDVVSAGSSSFRLYVHFRTPTGWQFVTIAAATNVQRWLKAVVTDVDGDGRADIVAGGYSTGASIDYFTSSTPRNGASWTRHTVGPVGATYSLVIRDVDRDGDPDLVVSDRDTILTPAVRYDLRGSRWLENTGGVWVNHTIGLFPNARWLHVSPDARLVVDGSPAALTIRTSEDGLHWGAQPVPIPTGVGQFNAVERADVDGDGLPDLVLTFSHAFDALSGVVWLRAPNWERGEISGPDGEKFDNLALVDVDCDGDLDVVTNEQGRKGDKTVIQLGNVWYENGGL
jgi:hypothetical protein